MTSDAENYLQDLKTLIPLARQIGYDDTSAANDIFEGWVLGLVTDEAKKAHWDVTFVNTPNDVFKFRAGPGAIYSADPFTYCRLEKHVPSTGHDAVLEVHLGVKVKGRSLIAHEFDVSVLKGAAANHARQTHSHPFPWGVVMQFECKLFSTDISLGVARGSVGLTIDCMLGGKGCLVTRKGGSDNAATLLKAYGIEHFKEMLPYKGDVPKLRECVRIGLENYLQDFELTHFMA